jgi:large subunit ribosomal protein L16
VLLGRWAGEVVSAEGKIIYEITGISEVLAKQALRTAAYKMPIKTKFLKAEK